MRLTAPEALTNLRTVLELCAAGDVECSHKPAAPSAAAICRKQADRPLPESI